MNPLPQRAPWLWPWAKLATLAFLIAMTGCAPGKEAAPRPVAALLLEQCQRPDGQARKQLTLQVQAPLNGSRKAVKSAVDDLRASDEAKGKAGLSVLDRYESCLGRIEIAASTPPPQD